MVLLSSNGQPTGAASAVVLDLEANGPPPDSAVKSAVGPPVVQATIVQAQVVGAPGSSLQNTSENPSVGPTGAETLAAPSSTPAPLANDPNFVKWGPIQVARHARVKVALIFIPLVLFMITFGAMNIFFPDDDHGENHGQDGEWNVEFGQGIIFLCLVPFLLCSAFRLRQMYRNGSIRFGRHFVALILTRMELFWKGWIRAVA